MMEMIKLEKDTWYYLYTDGEDFFLSTDPPTKREEDKWWHPDRSELHIVDSPLNTFLISSGNTIQWCKGAFKL